MHAPDNVYVPDFANQQRLNQAIAEIGQRRMQLIGTMTIVSLVVGFIVLPWFLGVFAAGMGGLCGRSIARSRAMAWVPEVASKHRVDRGELYEAVGLANQL